MSRLEFDDPYRGFVRNLGICSGKAVALIHDELCEDIALEITRLSNSIERDLNAGDIAGETCISPYFKKFLDEKEEKAPAMSNPGSRNSPYCIYEFFEWIEKLFEHVAYLKRNNKTLNKGDVTEIQRFIKLLNQYQREFNAEVISTKNLERFFDKKGGKYNSRQSQIIAYLLKRVFPKMKKSGKPFLASLLEMDFKQILYGNCKSGTILFEPHSPEAEEIEHLWNQMYDYSPHQYDVIGDALLSIYEKLTQMCDAGRLSKISEYESVGSETNSEKEDLLSDPSQAQIDTAKLSSHITAFMRWLPIIDDDTPNEIMALTLEFVERVSTQIKKQVNDELQKNACSNDVLSDKKNLFLESEILREKLMHFMQRDPIGCKIFCRDDAFAPMV